MRRDDYPTFEDYDMLDARGLIMTRACNPPNKYAKYSVFDAFGNSGFGATLRSAVDEYDDVLREEKA